MTVRDDLTTVLNGGTPERTPLSVYSAFMGGANAGDWWRLVDEHGLGVCNHCPTVRSIEHGVKDSSEERTEGNNRYSLFRKETPVGTIQCVLLNYWHHEAWLKTPRDYKVRQWIVENSELVPQYENFASVDTGLGERGITVVTGSRTPAMSINVDWAGTEQFCADIAVELDELMDLYEAERKMFLEEVRLIAAGPGRFVKWFENLTIGMLGPRRYEQLLMSIYRETIPVLEAAGKRVMVHYDGDLRVIAPQIAQAPFHIIESLTEPPEGDMMFDECRAAWPDMAFWGNINVGLYHLPKPQLREAILAMRQRAGKKAVAFEISEDTPHNFKETVPVVLDALRELD